jgi:transglutaminase-like putative cysteine protease
MNRGQNDLETVIASLNLLDHKDVDWHRVQRTAYLIHQHLRYDYPGPIEDLSQLLMIVPPEQYGDQRRVVYSLEVSIPPAQTLSQFDEFGNLVLNSIVPVVESTIDFEAWIVVERRITGEPHYIDSSWLTDSRMLEPSRLTRPDDALRAAAKSLTANGTQGLELAKRINSWAYHALKYENGVTSIRTSAAEALQLGKGVCQDFAHIMLLRSPSTS